MEEGLRILQDISKSFGATVIRILHEASHCAIAAEAVDILQIPAFLSRQTDLLLAAGNTGKPINVKKGQFLAPWDMWNVAEKSPALAIKTFCSASGAPLLVITHWSMILGA